MPKWAYILKFLVSFLCVRKFVSIAFGIPVSWKAFYAQYHRTVSSFHFIHLHEYLRVTRIESKTTIGPNAFQQSAIIAYSVHHILVSISISNHCLHNLLGVCTFLFCVSYQLSCIRLNERPGKIVQNCRAE